MARQERCFIMDCWAGSVRMATGETDDLSAVADAMHFWMRAPLVRAFVEQWPFLRTWELAEAHERGELCQSVGANCVEPPRGLGTQPFTNCSKPPSNNRCSGPVTGAKHEPAHLQPPRDAADPP
jgi:hypothetical protein